MLKQFLKQSTPVFSQTPCTSLCVTIITRHKMRCTGGVDEYSDDQEGGRRRNVISHRYWIVFSGLLDITLSSKVAIFFNTETFGCNESAKRNEYY